MGYETNFKITTEVDDMDKLVGELGHISDYDGWFDLYDGVIHIDAKWYEYDTHMRKISEQYKDTLFTVNGDGEESGDIWRKYYKNGKCMDASPEFIYPEFDEDKLE